MFKGLAGRLRSELGELFDQSGGFVVRKFKVLHSLDMGSRSPVANAADLAALLSLCFNRR
jgi:hypothetical protein